MEPQTYETRPNRKRAMQFLPKDPAAMAGLWGFAGPSLDRMEWDEARGVHVLFLKTMESHGETQVAYPGNYIVEGLSGEHYPCEQSTFEKSYRRVE